MDLMCIKTSHIRSDLSRWTALPNMFDHFMKRSRQGCQSAARNSRGCRLLRPQVSSQPRAKVQIWRTTPLRPILTFSAVGRASGLTFTSLDKRSKRSRGMRRLSHDRNNSGLGMNLLGSLHQASRKGYSQDVPGVCDDFPLKRSEILATSIWEMKE